MNIQSQYMASSHFRLSDAYRKNETRSEATSSQGSPSTAIADAPGDNTNNHDSSSRLSSIALRLFDLPAEMLISPRVPVVDRHTSSANQETWADILTTVTTVNPGVAPDSNTTTVTPLVDVDLADPDRGSTTTGTHAEFNGGLFVGPDGQEIQFSDVRQGGLANCYFLAAVASVAHTNPDAIRNMIVDNGDGTYTVRFGGELGDVTVDDELLTNGIRPVGASINNGSGGPELWVAIIEKAYAQGRGTYEDTEWDFTATGMDDLLGEGSTQIQFADSFEKDDLDAALAAGNPLIANTYGSGNKKYDTNGIVGSHVYSILGYATDETNGEVILGDDGKPMIELYNPWGRGEFGNDGSDDGVFVMSWTEFQHNFNSVGIGDGTAL